MHLLMKRLLCDEGQMVTELFILIPAFVMVLVISVNLFAYFSILSKMDAMANEIARQLYQYPGSPAEICNQITADALQKNRNRHFLVSTSCAPSPDTFIEGRYLVTVAVRWYPFTSQTLRQKWPFFRMNFLRQKKMYISEGELQVRP